MAHAHAPPARTDQAADSAGVRICTIPRSSSQARISVKEAQARWVEPQQRSTPVCAVTENDKLVDTGTLAEGDRWLLPPSCRF